MDRPWSYGVARQREGSRQNSIGPRVNLTYQPYARAGADGQAVVCPLLRGSSPTRGVAPKQHRGIAHVFGTEIMECTFVSRSPSAAPSLLDGQSSDQQPTFYF